jgi:hypothetical protein
MTPLPRLKLRGTDSTFYFTSSHPTGSERGNLVNEGCEKKLYLASIEDLFRDYLEGLSKTMKIHTMTGFQADMGTWTTKQAL